MDYFSSQYLQNIIIRDSFWKKLEVCQKVVVDNCDVALSFNTCFKCLPNYFIQAGSCLPYPLPSILNCAVYSDLVTCTGCASGFFLDGNTCRPVIPIANCTVYSTTTAPTICLACISGFFLTSNSCSKRDFSLSIANCMTPSVTADTCAVCSSGFQVTSDGRKCLPALSNCQTYATSSSSDSALTCSLCANGFY